MLESKFQAQFIKNVRERLPGCVILKNDSSYLQGIPDLSIFYNDRYAFVECKAASDSPQQPNQEYYVETLNSMSYATFASPENENEVLDAIQQSLSAKR